MSGDQSPIQKETFADRLFKGSLWMIAMRWAVRLLGILSVAILARLLDKADFGLVAMASAAIALPRALLDTGVEYAIIREKSPTADIYNTAWTIRLTQMVLVSSGIWIAAPWVADFYNDHRILDILRVLAVAALIRGMENIWVIAFLKQYSFRRDFFYNTVLKIAGVTVTACLAYWLRSYWALVYGQLSIAVLRLVFSFYLAPEMARPTLRQWRHIWSFSQWSLVKGIANYVYLAGDRVILGRFASADIVGVYTVGREIADMPVSEISAPINRVLGPGFSNLQTEPQRLAQAVAKSVGAVATVAFPLAIGMALTAELLVPIALGPGWDEMVPLVQLLAVSGCFSCLSGIIGNALVVIGQIRTSTIVAWVRAFVFIGLGVPAVMQYGAPGLATAFLMTEVVCLFLTFFYFNKYVPALKTSAVLAVCIRPFVSVVLMCAPVVALRYSDINVSILELLAQIGSGAVVYTAALMSLWIMMGRPDSIETIVIEHIKKNYAKIMK